MAVILRRSTPQDLAFVTALERHPDNREYIGQWTDDEHLAAIAGKGKREHWIIERDGRAAGYLIAYDCRFLDAGFYVKRILVADKEGGTGTAALRQFNERVFAMNGVSCVWLIVRDFNVRAQHVYGKLGFARFEPAEGEERRRYDSWAEAPAEGSYRMRLART
ncbi:MAG TPA: GNAT family N-acetyltransferase [Usitatibacter sp.]|nr:GNAT family N-acetyltransferase [Usitatibacter sp.]